MDVTKANAAGLLRRTAALLLAVLLALTLAFSTATTARADDKQKELEAAKNSLQQQLNELNSKINDAKGDQQQAAELKSQYEQQANLLEQQLKTINAQIDELNTDIENKQAEIDAKQAEVDAKQAEYDARWAGFKERMSSMQMLNDGGGIALLSSATNLYELLTVTQALEDISAKDQEICQDLENQRVALDAEKQELENQKSELEATQATLADKQTQLDDAHGQLVDNIMAQDSTITAAEAEEQALAAEKSDVQAEFDKAADELDSYLKAQIAQYGSANISCSLDFINPFPAGTSFRITCQFGAGGHKGVDLATSGGTPIYAVASGVVTTAATHSSYGNYVQVYHGTDDSGNTYATLYAHMVQFPSVSAGQSVSKGDLLGYVGSTGNSTGNHLHLEMRVNGARTNALNYIPH